MNLGANPKTANTVVALQGILKTPTGSADAGIALSVGNHNNDAQRRSSADGQSAALTGRLERGVMWQTTTEKEDADL